MTETKQSAKAMEMNTISKSWEIQDPDGRSMCTLVRVTVDYSYAFLPNASARLEEVTKDYLWTLSDILQDPY